MYKFNWFEKDPYPGLKKKGHWFICTNDRYKTEKGLFKSLYFWFKLLFIMAKQALYYLIAVFLTFII
jgi:hypothetical protein